MQKKKKDTKGWLSLCCHYSKTVKLLCCMLVVLSHLMLLIQYWSCLHSLWVLIWIYSSVVISWQCVLCIKIEVQLFKHYQWCHMWVCSNYIKIRTRHLVFFFFFAKNFSWSCSSWIRWIRWERLLSVHVVPGPLRDYILTYSTGCVTSLYVFISLL